MSILVAIATYQDEKRIVDVLRGLPKCVRDSSKYHILLSDDASEDQTVEDAKNYLRASVKNFTILKMAESIGFGGNQKVCYRFAIENNFDAVILLRGDACYPPDLVSRIAHVFESQDAEIIVGNRKPTIRQAREFGLPFFKLVGDIALMRIQNDICQSHLSEMDTGFRAYATRLLKKIPFELNSDGFLFDTEMLLQSFHCDAKLREIHMPFEYVNEMRHISFVKYAWRVILASYRYRLQKMGLLVSLKFPHSANQIYQNKIDDPNSTHAVAIRCLEKHNLLKNTSILDVGCGEGHIGFHLKNHSVRFTGIDFFEPKKHPFHSFIKMDLENEKWNLDITQYDAVLLLDVLEHLSRPEKILLAMRYGATGTVMPKMIVSVPNIGFILMRINLLLGRFNYADRGILDIRHKRFFSYRTFQDLLSETGHLILEKHGIGVPFQTLKKGFCFRKFGEVSAFLARFYPSLFAFQFLVVVQPKLTAYHRIKISET